MVVCHLTMTEENAQSISMEEEKEEAPDAMEEEENPPTFTERGSPRLVIRQMVRITRNQLV